jgi:hypothetical protein
VELDTFGDLVDEPEVHGGGTTRATRRAYAPAISEFASSYSSRSRSWSIPRF